VCLPQRRNREGFILATRFARQCLPRRRAAMEMSHRYICTLLGGLHPTRKQKFRLGREMLVILELERLKGVMKIRCRVRYKPCTGAEFRAPPPPRRHTRTVSSSSVCSQSYRNSTPMYWRTGSGINCASKGKTSRKPSIAIHNGFAVAPLWVCGVLDFNIKSSFRLVGRGTCAVAMRVSLSKY
jgi:hypothetical protein